MEDKKQTKSAAVLRSNGWQDHLFMAFVYFITIGALVIVGIPVINIIACSFSDGNLVQQGKVFLIPKGFNLEAYDMVLRYPGIWRGYRNSLMYVVLGTTINLTVTTMAAFPMSRKEFFGRGFIMVIFTITMFFGGGLVPTYMVVMKLGMVDTIWAILIPGSMGVWNMIVMRTFFTSTIPEDLYEATLLDGGGDLTFLIHVVLPLSHAVMAVMGLMFAVGRWNSYFAEMIYLNNDNLMPLQTYLRRILVLNQMKAGIDNTGDVESYEKAQRLASLMKYALIIVASVPVMVMYPFVQRFFMQGVMIGSIKG